jgi:hypothetical protein
VTDQFAIVKLSIWERLTDVACYQSSEHLGHLPAPGFRESGPVEAATRRTDASASIDIKYSAKAEYLWQAAFPPSFRPPRPRFLPA